MENNKSRRTTIYIPENIHKQFKIYCINRGETITGELLKYMKAKLDIDINARLEINANEYVQKLMGSDGFE